ncbi:hypothetical protein ACFQMB_05845 [Pseudobowmanella zhangzhouensis]|uniref:hypothetical protein n=1 Tax=Pseudobowmanella zhangzhouensis TaxID=1537679 RepID=UPI0036174D11
MRQLLIASLMLLLALPASATPGASAPNRPAGEGDGPFPRLILRGANYVSGEGAPCRALSISLSKAIALFISSAWEHRVPLSIQSIAPRQNREIKNWT